MTANDTRTLVPVTLSSAPEATDQQVEAHLAATVGCCEDRRCLYPAEGCVTLSSAPEAAGQQAEEHGDR